MGCGPSRGQNLMDATQQLSTSQEQVALLYQKVYDITQQLASLAEKLAEATQLGTSLRQQLSTSHAR